MKKTILVLTSLLFFASCAPKELASGDMVRVRANVTGIQGVRILNFWYQSSTADGTQVDSVTIDGLYLPAQWAPTTEVQIMEGQIRLDRFSNEEGSSPVKTPDPVYGVLIGKEKVVVELFIQGELFGQRCVEVESPDEDVQ